MKKNLLLFLISGVCFTFLNAASNNKIVFFSGLYSGTSVSATNFSQLKKSFYKSVFNNDFDRSLESENMYKELSVSKIGKHKFVSMSDGKNYKKSLKSIVFSFVSLDDIITFHETQKTPLGIATRINIYNLFSFYAVELKSMRILYSKQFILPMNMGLEGEFSQDEAKKLFEASLVKKKLFYSATKEVLKRSLHDSQFIESLDKAGSDMNFLQAKKFMLIQNTISAEAKEKISKHDEFSLFSSYAMTSTLSNELPLLSPVLANAMREDGKFKNNDPYLLQIKKNVDTNVKTLSYKLNMILDQSQRYKGIKVSGKKLELPELTFPDISVVFLTESFFLEKILEQNTISMKKLFAVKHKFRAKSLKTKFIQKSIDISEENMNKMKNEFVLKDGVIESLPNTTSKQSDLYFFNASLNAANSKKMKIGDHYDLKCLVRAQCTK